MRVLVAGIGNIFLGDDAFGVAVVVALRSYPFPETVTVRDFGTRGLDLAYAIEDCDAAILVDTVCRGGSPGTLYLLDPDSPGEPVIARSGGPSGSGAGDEAIWEGPSWDPHAMTPDRVLAWIASARAPAVIRIVGCEPATFGPEGLGQDGLSPEVQASVPIAAEMVIDLAQRLCHSEAPARRTADTLPACHPEGAGAPVPGAGAPRDRTTETHAVAKTGPLCMSLA